MSVPSPISPPYFLDQGGETIKALDSAPGEKSSCYFLNQYDSIPISDAGTLERFVKNWIKLLYQ